MALGFLALAVFELTAGGEDDKDDKSVQDLLALLASPENASTIGDVTVEPLGGDSAKYVVHDQSGSTKMTVLGPYNGAGNILTDALSAQGVAWTLKPETESPWWQMLLISLLPLCLVLAVVIFFMKKGQGGTGPMQFGKSTAKLLNETQTKVTFKDVAGIQEAREDVEEIIAFLDDPRRYTRLGGRIPKGVLLMGSPGTGKTLLARAIAGEADVPFFSIAGSDFVEMFVGVGASRVRDLFAQGKKSAPCIIFIDEIDAVGRQRGAGIGGGNDEREQTLNQLLVEMDGFESNDGVILIAATNRPDVLDPALLRPGRFDRRIHVSLPDINGRLGILNIHTRKMPIAEGVDLSAIARGTSGFSGADLGNLTNEGALLAAKRNRDEVDMVDFEDAKDKVLMGNPRNSMFVSERQRCSSAMNEAGHALVSVLIGGDQVDPLHKVTIVPRGSRLGLTLQLPVEDRLTVDRDYLLNRICILMGGRVAEELLFQERSSSASRAIEEATNLARKMVTEWGMSEELGPVNYSGGKHEIFLGKEMTETASHCSDSMSRNIDSEVGRFVNEQCDRATRLLKSHLATLRAIGEALLSRETLSGAEVEALVAANGGGVAVAT